MENTIDGFVAYILGELPKSSSMSIAISGRVGTGKTRLAHKLQEALLRVGGFHHVVVYDDADKQELNDFGQDPAHVSVRACSAPHFEGGVHIYAGEGDAEFPLRNFDVHIYLCAPDGRPAEAPRVSRHLSIVMPGLTFNSGTAQV